MKSNENLKQRFLAMARADIEVSGQLYVAPQDEDDVAVIVGAFLRRKNLRSHKLLSQIGFIVESYQEHAWYVQYFFKFSKISLFLHTNLFNFFSISIFFHFQKIFF